MGGGGEEGQQGRHGGCTHLESTDTGARVDQFALRGDAGAHADDPDAGTQAAVVGQLGEGAEGGVRLDRERETGERECVRVRGEGARGGNVYG